MLDYFDKVIVLNLKTRPDRLRETLLELGKLHLGRKVTIYQPNPETGDYRARHKAASMSHFGIIEQAQREGRRNVLVFEDDMEICNVEQIPAIEAQLQAVEWDMFYLGYNCGMDTSKKVYQVSPHLGRLSWAQAQHAYAVNACFYDDFLRLRDILYQVDTELDIILASSVVPRCRAFGGIPITAIQRAGWSDIEQAEIPATTWMHERLNSCLVNGCFMPGI